jgi:hypothetical protein
VKYLIPAAAILVLGLCGLVRHEAAAVRPDRVAPRETLQAMEPPQVAEAARDSRLPEPKVETVQTPTPAVPGPDPAAAPDIREMLQTLRARLELTSVQEPQIAEALRLRVKELQACQEAYRKTGVFIPREYGSQLVRMKETWYRRIDGMLDSQQHQTFDRLVAEGFFRPGTDFMVDLMTMSVLR